MKNGLKRKRSSKIIHHIFLVAICIVLIYPVIWWVMATFKPISEINLASLFAKEPTLSNFIKGWNALPRYSFTLFFFNSIKLNVTVAFLTAFSSSLVAFGFTKFDFPLKKLWFSIVLTSIMLPSQVTLISRYSMFYKLGWTDSYLPFISVSAIGVPYFIFLLIQFMKGLPRELDNAARIDGCNWWSIYWRIVLPLSKPAVITAFLFSFLWGWEDYMLPLVYINSINKFTVPLALGTFIDQDAGSAWGQLLAISLLSVTPVIILFFSAQRYFVEGIQTTGLKG